MCSASFCMYQIEKCHHRSKLPRAVNRPIWDRSDWEQLEVSQWAMRPLAVSWMNIADSTDRGQNRLKKKKINGRDKGYCLRIELENTTVIELYVPNNTHRGHELAVHKIRNAADQTWKHRTSIPPCKHMEKIVQHGWWPKKCKQKQWDTLPHLSNYRKMFLKIIFGLSIGWHAVRWEHKLITGKNVTLFQMTVWQDDSFSYFVIDVQHIILSIFMGHSTVSQSINPE